MLGTSTRSGFRGGCGRTSWRPPSDLVDQVHASGARTGKGPQMANPRPTPKPENLRPPWPPGTSGNPAGYSRGRRVSDTIKRLIDEKALDRDFGATAITIVAEGATHSLNTGNVVVEGAAGATHSLNTGNVGGPQRPSRKVHGRAGGGLVARRPVPEGWLPRQPDRLDP